MRSYKGRECEKLRWLQISSKRADFKEVHKELGGESSVGNRSLCCTGFNCIFSSWEAQGQGRGYEYAEITVGDLVGLLAWISTSHTVIPLPLSLVQGIVLLDDHPLAVRRVRVLCVKLFYFWQFCNRLAPTFLLLQGVIFTLKVSLCVFFFSK